MSGKVTLYAATLESCEIPIKTDSDPTGDVPQFGIVTVGSVVGPASYISGTWVSAYNAATERTTARTPTLGTGGSLVIVSGTTYDLWASINLGGEVARWPVGQIYCP